MACDKFGGSLGDNSGCVVCGGCAEEIRRLCKLNLKLTLQRDIMLEHFDHDGHPDVPFGPTCSKPDDCVKCQVYALEKAYEK